MLNTELNVLFCFKGARGGDGGKTMLSTNTGTSIKKVIMPIPCVSVLISDLLLHFLICE